MSTFAGLADKTGLELVRMVLDGNTPDHETMLGTMNFWAVSFDKGQAVYEGLPEEKHLNLAGRVHGGWALTVMDTSMGSAVMSSLPPGKASTTATMESKFLRAVKAGTSYRSTGNVVRTGRMLAHVRSEMIEIESGKVVGTATGTFAIIDNV